MAESLILPDSADRAALYTAIIPQIRALISNEPDLIANLANTVAVIKETFRFFWVGFYLVKENELVLGPFQGSIACTRIAFNRGVCGHCYQTRKTVVVPDVDQFEGHIACSSATKSEIVIPVFNSENELVAVLDVDSDCLNDFSSVDQKGLESIVELLQGKFL